MKKYLLVLIFLAGRVFAQPNYEVIYNAEYKELPFGLEIDNSGIYSIASFDVVGDNIEFSSFNASGIYKFYSGKFKSKTNLDVQGKDFLSGIKVDRVSALNKSANHTGTTQRLYRKNFLNKKSYLIDNNGELTGSNNESIRIKAESRDRLVIETKNLNLAPNIRLKFPDNLAMADLIGIDSKGNMFFVVEKYLSEIPLKIQREVYTLSNNGEVLSILELPNIKYLYTLKDLQIDYSGNLYHLLSDKEKVKIIKWSDLASKTQNIIHYPSEYKKEIHFNNYVPIDEAETTYPDFISGVHEFAGRTEALKIAETYVLHQYSCNSNNLAPTNTTAPDGDIVRTPDRLVVGMNVRIPYKWGGFNTLAQFDDALQNGRYAGDINTDGVSSYAVGVDCSGYVSRCWQMSYHSSTASMPNITTQYASWNDLKPGDAIHKVGHVRLFVERNINGSLKIVESTSRGWGVSYYSYNTSDLSAYTPRYYNNMVDNYNAQKPTLKYVDKLNDESIKLNWSCDTIGIQGYRVYESVDGTSWSVVLDENTCKITSAKLSFSEEIKYYRISSIKSNSDFSESNWSNVLGVGDFSSEKECLIVDGFNRESGSWRGPGHAFALKYGKALEVLSLDFRTIKNSELLNTLFNLDDYDIVFWILGDESTVDETFSHEEQALVKSYLESGGYLFVSGSEVGWDLDYKGDSQDNSFYYNYLKAKYISDDAISNSAIGVINSSMDECSFLFGQTYDEDYPDEIEAINGSSICMKYNNGKDAGVQFSGKFGSSTESARLIYLAFPLETTADNSSFHQVISSAYGFFTTAVSVDGDKPELILDYKLEQNYPNPFNPSTTIKYSIPSNVKRETTNTKLIIYDLLGREISMLVNKEQKPGNYEVQFNASNLSSGIYFYKITSGNFISIKKMTLLK